MKAGVALRTLSSTLGVGIAITLLQISFARAADVLDCAAAQRAASNPYTVGQVGNSGNGWMFGKAAPAILAASGDVKKEGLNDKVRGEIQAGDKLQATIKLFDMRSQSKLTKSASKATYLIRWIAPRDTKFSDKAPSRCSDEVPITIEAGTSMLHTISMGDVGLDDISGTWQMVAYDAKGNPLPYFDYELENMRSKDKIASDILEENYRLYMVIDKCIALSSAPLSKDDYRNAISTIDKKAKQGGIDTEAAWKRAVTASQVQSENWDQQIATATNLNWEARRILRSSCAGYSGQLIAAAREASGTKPTPKKDF